MAKLFLHIALVDLGRGGKAGAQRVAGKLLLALELCELRPDAGGEGHALDQPGDLLVGQTVRPDILASMLILRSTRSWN